MSRLLLAALLAAAACNTGFDPQYRVEDLRVLAVRSQVVGSSSADAAPGDTVRLEALVATPPPLDRAQLSVRWFACIPTGTTEVPACLDPDFLRDPASLAGRPGVLEIGQGEQVTILVPDVDAAFDEAIALAIRSPTFLCRIYVELPVVAVAELGARRETAVKRVRLVPPAGTAPQSLYSLNLGPGIGELFRGPLDETTCAGGTPLLSAPFPAGRTVLCGQPSPGSIQTYNECDPDGNATSIQETLSWQWYVTAGEMPEFDGTGNAVGDAVELERDAGPFTIWTILRDGRGGVAWVQRDVAALP